MTDYILNTRDEENVIAELIRSELLKLLVKVQCNTTNHELEESTRQLIGRLDDIQIAFEISKKNELLPLEPVNVTEVADLALHKLTRVVKDIKVKPTYRHKTPVLAHRESLVKSLESMLYSVLDTSPNCSDEQIIELNTLRCDAGVRLGVYSKDLLLEAKELRNLNKNSLSSARLSASLSPLGITNLFIANTLLSAMGAPLRTSINNRDRGVATVLPFSKQLELVKT